MTLQAPPEIDPVNTGVAPAPPLRRLWLAISPGILGICVSLVVPFLLATFVIRATGHDVGSALAALWNGSTGIDFGPPLSFDRYTGGRIAAEATPLLLCGLAVGVCLKAGLFNIGATGQMTIGAFAAAWIGNVVASHNGPASPILPVIAGCLAGGLCGALAGWLKAYRNVHEVISTIMLNYIMIDVTQYFIANQLREPGSLDVQTAKLPTTMWLTAIVPGTNLSSGVIITLVALLVCTILIAGTAFGYRVRALGAGPAAARASGIPTALITVQIMGLAGMLAGMAGAVQVLGVYHRCVQDVAGSYGFQGIAVALLANGVGVGMLVSSLFFGGLSNGATIMQLQTGVPSSLIAMIQAIIIAASVLRLPSPERGTSVFAKRVIPVRGGPGKRG